MTTNRPRALAVLAALCLATIAQARILSYAPYTDAHAIPALQHRMNRHFVLLERVANSPVWSVGHGQVVLYDSTSAREPRVVFPPDGGSANYWVAAVRENAQQVPSILLQTDYNFNGTNPNHQPIFVLSTDAGATWRTVPLTAAPVYQVPRNIVDVGGPFAKSRYSPVRIGTERWPFVVAVRGGVYAIGSDASTRLAASSIDNYTPQLAGSDITGRLFIVRSAPDTLMIADTEGGSFLIGSINPDTIAVEGWLTSDSNAYIELNRPQGVSLKYVHTTGVLIHIGPDDGTYQAPAVGQSSGTPIFFTIPTADFRGAWLLTRGPNRPTILYKHTTDGLQRQWADVTAPEVEALHAGMSGRTLLVQVHRPRQQPDQRLFIDPALAVWTEGEGAPRQYDELFMNEQPTKAFVHLDVDRLKQGEPFVFDSGFQVDAPMLIISPAAGGGDVIQEWGVVRSSLVQRLVLPGISRTQGAYGSNWLSDVIIENPSDQAQRVNVRYVPTGEAFHGATIREVDITLQPLEIRLIPDALRALFGVESGGGAFFLTPDAAITASSRTYSRSSAGTYGFHMNAIDQFAAVGPRFPVSFAGAFPGLQFRTNIVLTDVTETGSMARVTATGQSGAMGIDNVAFATPVAGQTQINNLGASLNLFPHEAGALIVTPARGFVIPSVFAIDNKTNDPTYFPPDLPAPIVRTIPVIGHIDGANGSRFRSDLHLYNPPGMPRTVTLQMKMWDTPDVQNLTLTLLPGEARVIKDVLFTAFNRSGLARIRYQSTRDALGVRVTSRTYSIGPDGGTFGFLMPPLNNFQVAGAGDTLEILGTVIDNNFRTNIGIVDLAAFAGGPGTTVKVEILDHRHAVIDSFTTNVVAAGGMQINDVFRARGLDRVSGMPVLIRVSPTSNGVIGAYATMTDNNTNDSTYIGANLASKN